MFCVLLLLLQEARCLWRCHKLGIGAPYVRWVDEVESRLFLSKIDGITVRQFIDTTSDATGAGTAPSCTHHCASHGMSPPAPVDHSKS